jgi:hypothetical protein
MGGLREGAGEEGRNDPNIVCTYEYNKNLKKLKNSVLRKKKDLLFNHCIKRVCAGIWREKSITYQNKCVYASMCVQTWVCNQLVFNKGTPAL